MLRGQPVFSRAFLRGFREALWGKEMISSQTDLNFKLLDSLDISFGLLSPTYLGLSLWYDYTRLNQIQFLNGNSENKNRKFEAMGYEIKSAWEILGIPTLHRFGQAWMPDRTRLESYYILEIPLRSF